MSESKHRRSLGIAAIGPIVRFKQCCSFFRHIISTRFNALKVLVRRKGIDILKLVVVCSLRERE